MTEVVGRRAGPLQESWLQDSAHIVSESWDCIEAWMPQEEEEKLSWEKADVSFTPSIDEVTRCLHSVVDNLVLSVQRFPRIEHQLFQVLLCVPGVCQHGAQPVQLHPGDRALPGLGEELASLQVHVPMERLLLDCPQWMVQRTHQLASISISRVASSLEQLNRSICQQYEDIVSRITTISGSTSTLVELQGYMDKQ
ncbi:uncharacterized protein LOC121320123 isoform X1 [Polyodon spathula]|uniref:uncharacterized protein LOC121320123 isoform X1 n=1 Tax=Polyodon spathula TaxID=7913 RepID=UPI001B7EB674|nr:uncharacterized protein LOC121320123 isoform X1 [Polyodon spathula]